jgi:hypothetical protein
VSFACYDSDERAMFANGIRRQKKKEEKEKEAEKEAEKGEGET